MVPESPPITTTRHQNFTSIDLLCHLTVLPLPRLLYMMTVQSLLAVTLQQTYDNMDGHLIYLQCHPCLTILMLTTPLAHPMFPATTRPPGLHHQIARPPTQIRFQTSLQPTINTCVTISPLTRSAVDPPSGDRPSLRADIPPLPQ